LNSTSGATRGTKYATTTEEEDKKKDEIKKIVELM
jgi:hypothetical protein